MSRVDGISIGLSCLALVVAAASLAHSIAVDNRTRADHVDVLSMLDREHSVEQLIRTEGPSEFTTLTWEVSFANVGASTASLTGYDLVIGGGGAVPIPPGADGGMVRGDGTPIQFPRTIDAGATLDGFVRVNVPLDTMQIDVLRYFLAYLPTSEGWLDTDAERPITATVLDSIDSSVLPEVTPEFREAMRDVRMPLIRITPRTTRGAGRPDYLLLPGYASRSSVTNVPTTRPR